MKDAIQVHHKIRMFLYFRSLTNTSEQKSGCQCCFLVAAILNGSLKIHTTGIVLGNAHINGLKTSFAKVSVSLNKQNNAALHRRCLDLKLSRTWLQSHSMVHSVKKLRLYCFLLFALFVHLSRLRGHSVPILLLIFLNLIIGSPSRHSHFC